MPSKPRALVAEDNELMNGLLSRKFEGEGFEATSCFDGNDGLDAMKSTHFDCILLDLLMPRVSGFEVLEHRAETQNANTPTFILTSMAEDVDRARALKLGAKEVYSKHDSDPRSVVHAIVETVTGTK